MPFRRLGRALASACSSVKFEYLEPRRLFTQLVSTIESGESFAYSDAEGNVIRVTLSGNITAELIGSYVNSDNVVGLNDLPGRILTGTRAGLNLNGGFAGGPGIDDGNILPTSVNDTGNELGSLTREGISLLALATNAAGETYAFNLSQILVDGLLTQTGAPVGTPPTPVTPSVTVVQLVQINSATGAGTAVDYPQSIERQLTLVAPSVPILDATTNISLLISSVTHIPAATFGDDGLLYFVTIDHPAKARQDFNESLGDLPATATPGTPGGPTTVAELQTPRLWRVNVTTGVVESIPGSFNINANNRGPLAVRSIAFNSQGTLYAYALETTGATTAGAAGTTRGVIFTVPLGNTNGRGPSVPVTFDGENVDDITGIEFIPGNDLRIIAVTSGTPTDAPGSTTQQTGTPTTPPAAGDDETSVLLNVPSVLSITLGGVAEVFGALAPPGGGVGNDIEGLTWFDDPDPNVIDNPFTGANTGVLLGTDQTTDSLVRIDSRNRFSNSDLYTIYVSQSDATGSIVVSANGRTKLDVFGNNTDGLTNLSDVMTPFVDSIGQLRVLTAQPGNDTVLVDADAGTGKALLGARKKAGEDNDEDRPFILAPVEQQFGALPASYNVLAPGLISAPGQDMNRFFWAGTVTGSVDLGGSIETFYSGWLLTGNTAGDKLRLRTISDNFRVAGDLRNLITVDTIGSDTGTPLQEIEYMTGFDLQVGGVLGQIQTTDDFVGGFQVNNTGQTGLTGAYSEIESRGLDPDEGVFFEFGSLYQGETFWNDDFDTPQYLGTVTNGVTRGVPGVVVNGGLIRSAAVQDFHDYYAVTFTGGQTIQIRVITTGFPPPVHVGVFDPDGLLIAADYSNIGSITNVEFQLTLEKAGTYRFAIATEGDADFTAGGEFEELPAIPTGYQLSIRNVGALAVGALATAGVIYDAGVPNSFGVTSGDLGLMKAGTILASEFTGGIGINVAGNLRSLKAAQIGTSTALTGTLTTFGQWYNINVGGDVGLIQTDLFMILNRDPFYGGTVRNYQTVDSGGTLLAKLFATQAIGTIAAADMSTLNPTLIRVNVDNTGFDGRIDLIDVTGDFGTGSAGGPQITTGPGGDVRYIRVGGTVYRDAIFGSGIPDETDFTLGTQIDLVDDSGALIHLSPGELLPNPLYNPLDPLSAELQFLNAAQLTSVLTYGIRGSAGSVLVRVNSSESLIATSTASQVGAAVQIGEVNIGGAGRPETAVDPEDTLPGPGTDTTGGGVDDLIDPVVVNLNGSARIDIFQLNAGNLNTFINSTRGEIVNLQASSVGTFTTIGDIGLPTNSTGAAIRPGGTVEDTYPFEGQRTHIVVTGDIVSMTTQRALGNLVVGGAIGSLIANADNSNDSSRFEGIAGPVVATDLYSVNIGEGLASSGTGQRALSGLYARDRIIRVVNQGLGSDIRGDIVAQGSIGEIALTDGALINADVMVVATFDQAREINSEYVALPNTNPINLPVFEIERVTVTGRGGIIGTLFVTTDIGPVNVNKGFGILNSNFLMLGVGVFDGIETDGYGIRNVVIDGGSSGGDIIANGSGRNISTATFTPSVRRSETQEEFDPFTGLNANRLTDLHATITTSAENPIIEGSTNSGVIEDIFAAGIRDLGKVKGSQIRSTNPLNPSRFNYANSIESIETLGNIRILNVSTGKLKKFKPARDVFATNLTIAGPIDSVLIKGNFAEDSSINSVGPNGRIGKIDIRGNVDGQITSTGSVGTIKIGRNLTGGINIAGRGKQQALKTFTVGGSVSDGALLVKGSVGTIDAKGGFGVSGDSLTITGNLNKLKVGSSKRSADAVMGLNLTVNGTLSNLNVRGSITGDVHVGNQLKKLTVNRGKATGPILVDGDITAGSKIGKVVLKGGSVNGSFISTLDFTSFELAGGDFLAGNTIGSAARGIGSIKLTRGSFLGNVANGGKIGTFSVRGNLGDGVTPLTFNAGSIGKFSIGGSVLNGVTVQVGGKINSLTIGGNVDAGASITAASIGKRKISGAELGFVTA